MSIENIERYRSAFRHDSQWEWERFVGKMEEKARSVFHAIVKPFCRKRRWRFIAGNGTWSFFPPNHRAVACPGDWSCDDVELESVCDLLRTEIPGMPANDIGSMMPSCEDYTEEEG
jgi:hypothetical protein